MAETNQAAAPAGQPAVAEPPFNPAVTSVVDNSASDPAKIDLADSGIALSTLDWSTPRYVPPDQVPAGQPEINAPEQTGQSGQADAESNAQPAPGQTANRQPPDFSKAAPLRELFDSVQGFHGELNRLASKSPGDANAIRAELDQVLKKLDADGDLLSPNEAIKLHDHKRRLEDRIKDAEQHKAEIGQFAQRAEALRKQADGYIKQAYPQLFEKNSEDRRVLEKVVYPLLNNIPGFSMNPYDGVIAAVLTELVVKTDKYDKLTSVPRGIRPAPPSLESGNNPPTNSGARAIGKLLDAARSGSMSWGTLARKLNPKQF